MIGQINANSWTGQFINETPAQAERRRKETVSFLTAFVLGDDMSVGAGDDRCDLKVLNPSPTGLWEVWELRATPTRPITRIFLAVYGPTEFVAAACHPKAAMTRTGTMSQTNLAQIALVQARQLTRPDLPLVFTRRPRASDLGGEAAGFYDE